MACIARKIISGIKKDVGKSNQQPVLQSLKLIGVAFYILKNVFNTLYRMRAERRFIHSWVDPASVLQNSLGTPELTLLIEVTGRTDRMAVAVLVETEAIYILLLKIAETPGNNIMMQNNVLRAKGARTPRTRQRRRLVHLYGQIPC